MAKTKNRFSKKIKKLHTATKVLAALFLIIGIAAGGAVCLFMSKNDHFVLKGDTAFSIDAGTPYTYKEQGVDAVCFGLDVSNKLEVETELQRDAEGNYIIPTDKEGVYTITYTVDAPKFNGKLSEVQIKRIRTFTVNATEEDGYNIIEEDVNNG